MEAKNYPRLIILLFCALLVGCNSVPKHKVHYSLVKQSRAVDTDKILLLPMDISVAELSAGGLREEVGAWSEQARANLQRELDAGSHNLSGYSLVSMPELNAAEQAVVEQHLALLDTVGGSALMVTNPVNGKAWEHKSLHFDYGIGDGLAFLAERTGADLALMIHGDDLVSSGGRKATFVLAAAFGVAIPMGHAALVGCVVDLNTGDVLWLNHEVSTTSVTLREPADAAQLLSNLLLPYPGVESYQAYLKGKGAP